MAEGPSKPKPLLRLLLIALVLTFFAGCILSLIAGGAFWAVRTGKFRDWSDGVQQRLVPPDDTDTLWWDAKRNFHDETMGLAEGCPWKYQIGPGASYIIGRARRAARAHTKPPNDVRSEIRPDAPPIVSLWMACGHFSSMPGRLEFGLRVTRVGNRRVSLPPGGLTLILNYDGPLPVTTPPVELGAIRVPSVVEGDDGRIITMSPTDEAIRGFQGAWSMTTFILLDDETMVVAAFDLTHSTVHSEAIARECLER